MWRLWTILGFIVFAATAYAEPVRLVCTSTNPSDTWRWNVVFDLEEWRLSFNGKAWDLVAGDSATLAARVLERNWPQSLLIDRETGQLSLVNVGGFCQNSDCSVSKNGVLVQTAECSVPF